MPYPEEMVAPRRKELSSVALVVLAILLLLVLNACSSSDDPVAPDNNETSSNNNSVFVINEIDGDSPGIDALEFIELYDGGIGNTALDGYVLVLFNGSDNASYASFDLDGHTTDNEGFFLLGNAAVTPTPDIIIPDNSIQNGADAVALFTGDDFNFLNDTPVTATNLVDAIVYDTNDSNDVNLLTILTPGQPQINEDGAGNQSEHSNSRVPDGGSALETDTYVQQIPTPGASNQ